MVRTSNWDKRVGVPVDGELTTLAADLILLAFLVLIAYLVVQVS